MLRIRPEQLDVFEKEASQRFENEMVTHLQSFAPQHAAAIGESIVRKIVRMGRDRAAGYGFTNRGPVRFYLECMFMLGTDFDTDPQYRWAGQILTENDITHQLIRADQLYDRVMDFVDKVVGREYEHEEQAMQRLSSEVFDNVAQLGDEFKQETLRRLEYVYPQKFAYVGEEGLRALFTPAGVLARRYSMATSVGVGLFVGLMFAFGHGAATDPQFPWITAVLEDNKLPDGDERTENLKSTFIKFIAAGSSRS